MPENQSFQSLFQLAVALNVGFVAIATVYGSSISKERLKVEELSTTTSLFRNHCVESGAWNKESSELIKNVLNLRTDLKSEMASLDSFIDRFCRPGALVVAFIAFISLAYTSFDPTGKSCWFFPIVSILINAPLIVLIGYAYLRSVKVAASFAERRQKLDDELAERLQAVG